MKPASLRRQLLLGILMPMSAFLALGTWSQYRNALASAHAAFDRQLVSAARSIADTLHVESKGLTVAVPYAVLELHAPEPGSSLFHRVTGLDGELLAGDDSLPRYRGAVPSTPGYAGLVGLYEDRVAGTPVRVAVVYQPVEGHDRAGVVPVQVAEPLSNRELMARALLWQTLGTQFMLLLAVAGVTLWVVQRALRPLQRLRQELDLRDGNALAPLDEAGAGAELLPVLRALNALMARVRDMLSQQQRFVADAAHQLRTPLAVLQTQLQSGQSGDVEHAVLLREMQGTVRRATDLSRQLLSLARVQQLRGDGNAASCALGESAREAALELSPLIAERNLAFALDLQHDEEACAVIHPWLAGELIRNLLHNAIRHSPPAAALGIEVAGGGAEGGMVRWVCWDQGPGIAPEMRERVFEPFAGGGTPTPAGQPPGSGLGLSICRAIVLSCGGRIGLEDHRPGHTPPGLRVVVSLPRATARGLQRPAREL